MAKNFQKDANISLNVNIAISNDYNIHTQNNQFNVLK